MIEDVLLDDAGIAFDIEEKVVTAEIVIDGALDPHVDGHAIDSMIREKREAIRHLIADAFYFFERIDERLVVDVVQSVQIYPAVPDIVDGADDIIFPVAEPEPAEFLDIDAAELLDGREQIYLFVARLDLATEPVGDPFDRSRDRRDAFSLRDDKTDERLERRLTEDADAGAILGGISDIIVELADLRAERSIIRFEIKIIRPNVMPLALIA